MTTLTAEQDLIVAQMIADRNGGDAEEYLGLASPTLDAFDEFDGRHWAEWSRPQIDKDVALPNLYYEAVQAAKGQPRKHLWVVDFGSVRAVYSR